MSTPVHILGIVGSLRKASYNRALLRAAVTLAPTGMTIDTAEIGDIPLFNNDVYERGFPEPVAELRKRIAAADGILFVTPEYNYSIPGVLKNAIDWASRPPQQPFDGKPYAVMGASSSLLGTARAQYHLRQTAVFLNMFALNKPEVMVARAQDKFDAAGNLTDDATRDVVKKQLEAFAVWVRRLKS